MAQLRRWRRRSGPLKRRWLSWRERIGRSTMSRGKARSKRLQAAKAAVKARADKLAREIGVDPIHAAHNRHYVKWVALTLTYRLRPYFPGISVVLLHKQAAAAVER